MVDYVHHARLHLRYQGRGFFRRGAFRGRVRLLLRVPLLLVALLRLRVSLLLISLLGIALLPSVLLRITFLRLRMPLLPSAPRRIALLLRIRLLLRPPVPPLFCLPGLRRCFYRLPAKFAEARSIRQLPETMFTEHNPHCSLITPSQTV